MKVVIWIIIGLLVVGLLFWAMGATRNTSSEINSSDASLKTNIVGITPTISVSSSTVTYDGSSFSPTALTIKSGTTVTFTNNSSQPMWIASNPHPTHTDLPGFDSLKTLSKGQSYTFAFVKVGSWGYHNHLSTSQGGKVVVQ